MSDIIQKLISRHSKEGYVQLDLKRGIGQRFQIDGNVFETLPRSNQYMIDSEVLLSYIYQKIGLDVKQSIPIICQNREGIVREKLQKGKDYIHVESNPKRDIRKKDYAYFDSLYSAQVMDTFCYKDFADSYIKLALADMIFWIQDRYAGKMYIKKGGPYGMQEMATYDFSYPSYLANTDDLMYRFQRFYNGVYSPQEFRQEYIDNLNDFNFKHYVRPKEVIRLIENIDIRECANEIKDKFGYEISPKFLAFVEKTFYDSINEFKSKLIQ